MVMMGDEVTSDMLIIRFNPLDDRFVITWVNDNDTIPTLFN